VGGNGLHGRSMLGYHADGYKFNYLHMLVRWELSPMCYCD